MLLHINNMYFSWDPERIADVVASLDAAKPFVAYPGFTRLDSDGVNTQVSLDGRATTMPNQELGALLRNMQQELDAKSGPAIAYDSPSP